MITSCSTGMVDLTRQVWEPRHGRVLSEEAAHSILGNVTGFFSTLHRLSMAVASSS